MTTRYRNRQRRVLWSALVVSAILAVATANAFAAECQDCQSTAPAWPNLLSEAGRRAAMSLPKSSPMHLEPTLEDIEMGKTRQMIDAKAEFEKWRQHIATFPPNVRANNPAGDTTGETQSECAIASFGNNVVVAWNDSRGFTAGNTLSSYAYSTDAGNTFTDGGNVPLIAAGDQSYGDCTLDVDAAGNFYLAQIYVSAATGYQQAAVHRGTFTGPNFSWGTPVIAVTTPGGASAIDKPYLTCDKATGNVYVSYSRFSTIVAIEVVRGTALGTTWSAPVVLDNTSSGIQGSRPIVGPEGNLYVCWQQGWGFINCDMSSTNGAVLLKRSTNPTGAFTFGAAVTVGTVQTNWGSYWAGNLRNNALFFPDMTVDRSGGANDGNVYVIWNEAAPWGPPSASGISSAETEPNNNANDAGVKTITVGDNATGTVSSVSDLDYWKISVTAGQAIMLRLEPQGFNCGVSSTTRNFRLRLYKGNTPTAGDSILGNSNLNRFSSEIVWDAPETGTYFVRVQNVNSGGTTTGTYTLKSRVLTYGSPSPGRDMRDVVVARSTNLGVSFLPEVLVNDDPAGEDNCIPAITVDGCGIVHAFWYDNRDEQPSHVLRSYYRGVSYDGGLTWANQRVSDELMYYNLNTLAVPNYGEYNQAYGENNRVWTVWSDERVSNANTTGVDAYTSLLGACQTVPVQVENLAVSAGDHGVSLSWGLSLEAVRELSSVRVERADVEEGPYAMRSTQNLVPSQSMSFEDSGVEAGHTYWYRLELVSRDGTLGTAGPVRVAVSDLTSLRTALSQPMVSATGPIEVRFSLGRTGGAARLDVYDISGRLVKSLAQGITQPGDYIRTWDRRDESGTQVARGVYMIRLQAGNGGDTKKLVLVRE